MSPLTEGVKFHSNLLQIASERAENKGKFYLSFLQSQHTLEKRRNDIPTWSGKTEGEKGKGKEKERDEASPPVGTLPFDQGSKVEVLHFDWRVARTFQPGTYLENIYDVK